ncbi:MAG: hypothetical protein LH474_00375 [Chamaesiphon sp.]|nr:hypothetical protein [Chamaesiphon sp.]
MRFEPSTFGQKDLYEQWVDFRLEAEIENLPIITYDRAFQTGLIQVIPRSIDA